MIYAARRRQRGRPARAFAGARATTIIGPRALSITRRRARGTWLSSGPRQLIF